MGEGLPLRESDSVSKNNANNPFLVKIPVTPKLVGQKQIASVALGSPSTDVVLPGLVFPHKVKITGVKLLDGVGIAADNSNYVILELLNGATIVAECDTRAAHEGAVTANTAYPLNIVTAEAIQDAGAVLKVNYNETDAGTNVALTNAVLQVEYVQLPEDGDFMVLNLPKKTAIKSVQAVVGTTIAASNTDYLVLSLLNGSTEVAEMDTRAAHENGLTALTPEALNIVSGQEVQDADSDLKLSVDVHGDVYVDELALILELYSV